jgi:hypothetical protein
MKSLRERAIELLSYNRRTGVFTWKISPRRGIAAGTRAGRSNGNGYRRLTIDGVLFYEHRLAWLIIYGKMPKEIDHKNRRPEENQLKNLRAATRSSNCHNTKLRTDNRTGHRGVCYRNTKGWQAYISVNRKWQHLGYFKSLNEAVAARQAATGRKVDNHFWRR